MLDSKYCKCRELIFFDGIAEGEKVQCKECHRTYIVVTRWCGEEGTVRSLELIKSDNER